MLLQNLKNIFLSTTGRIGFVIGITAIALPSYYFTNKDLIIGNLGYNFFLLEITLTIIISILFGIFVAATLYKLSMFSIKKTSSGFLGGFLSILVAGCPSCSITLASYLGLSSLISIFPFSGIELKILAVILLLYVNYDLIKNLYVCKK